jgi:hypothetical protein
VLLRPGIVALESEAGKTITMRFAGVAAPSAPTGEQKLPGITSYLIGDKRNWVRGVRNYASVRYASVYPGIDVVFHGSQKHLEYDFVLSAGADPDQIRIAFEGVDRVVIDKEGNLELSAAHGTMKHRKPKIWQTGPRGQREVTGRYVLSGAAEARFEIDAYDRHDTLVIDPVIEYSTYFGSNRDDRAQAIATDSTGAAYLAGSTATGGMSWGFVSKLNPTGTAVVYTVFLGSGECYAAVRGIAVDSANNAIVTGYYTQKDVAGYCNVKRVLGAKINAAGNAYVYQLVWGGGQDYGNAVAVDGSGNAYFTGSTHGNFPTTAGVIFPAGGAAGDAFITKLDPMGAPVYSTYLGGVLGDEGLAITVNLNGNAYVAGSTASGNFPKTANAVQATMPNPTVTGFVTEVNSTATQILYSTFLGGNTGESVHGIAVDKQGKIHVTGSSNSSNFPTTANAWDRTCGADGLCNPYYDGTWHNAEDVFYSKIDPLKAGAAGLMYSTFLGGTKRDFGEAIAIDKNGRVWIAGRTASAADFPKVQPTQATFGGNYDAFIAQIDPAYANAASLIFSSFLGGALYDEATGVNSGASGDIHVAGYTGSANFPVVAALQPQTAGGNDGFIVKIDAPAVAAPASVALNPASVTGGAGSTGTVTLTTAAPVGGATVTLTSSNVNAATVPASVTVAANAITATFAIATKAVTTATAVTIKAAKAATLTVNPPAGTAALAAVSFNPATVMFGSNTTGTVTLTAAAPAGGAVVALSSSDWVSFNVPASVTVAAGATSAKFTVGTAIGKSRTTVTATYKSVNKTTILTSVYPTVVALTCTPNPVIAGNTTICTVTLNGIVPSPTTVWILSDQPFFAPASGTVTIPTGAVRATFSIATTLVPDKIVAHISANALATATVTAPLTINLTNRGRKWVLNNVTFKGGGTASGYFIYDPATAKYLAVNIRVTPGPDPLNPLGHAPQDLYYYPWPNGFKATFVDDWSTATLLSLQNPVTEWPPSWTLLQLNFARALTNAGGTIALVTNPNVAYTSYCIDNTPLLCTPPPANISQELFAMPPSGVAASGYYFRVIASGTVTAQ